jgi:hypothetical protein
MDDIDLDDYLSVRGNNSFDRLEAKIDYYEAIIAALVRKSVAEGNKIELNLNHVYKDTYLDVTINSEDSSIVKVTWREV